MRCPICKTSIANPPAGAELPKHFPFCSDRCKLIDLGRWLDGKYQIPVADKDETPDRAPQGEDGNDDDTPRRLRR